jgi:hypothetical protein
MWTKLNEMMLKHNFLKPNFKGFMVNRCTPKFFDGFNYGFKGENIKKKRACSLTHNTSWVEVRFEANL